jgi:hypothetical protein
MLLKKSILLKPASVNGELFAKNGISFINPFKDSGRRKNRKI